MIQLSYNLDKKSKKKFEPTRYTLPSIYDQQANSLNNVGIIQTPLYTLIEDGIEELSTPITPITPILTPKENKLDKQTLLYDLKSLFELEQELNPYLIDKNNYIKIKEYLPKTLEELVSLEVLTDSQIKHYGVKLINIIRKYLKIEELNEFEIKNIKNIKIETLKIPTLTGKLYNYINRIMFRISRKSINR
jgi:hypothetical protein